MLQILNFHVYGVSGIIIFRFNFENSEFDSPLPDIPTTSSNTASHFSRPASSAPNYRLAKFTSTNTPSTSRNTATNFSFNETNLARISHSLELLDRKIENISNRRDTATAALITVSRDDMVVYGSRFKQLLGQDFGLNEIYDHTLEYFVERYPFRYKLFKDALKLECPEGISFNDAFERLKNSWRQARHRSNQ